MVQSFLLQVFLKCIIFNIYADIIFYFIIYLLLSHKNTDLNYSTLVKILYSKKVFLSFAVLSVLPQTLNVGSPIWQVQLYVIYSAWVKMIY